MTISTISIYKKHQNFRENKKYRQIFFHLVFWAMSNEHAVNIFIFARKFLRNIIASVFLIFPTSFC